MVVCWVSLAAAVLLFVVGVAGAGQGECTASSGYAAELGPVGPAILVVAILGLAEAFVPFLVGWPKSIANLMCALGVAVVLVCVVAYVAANETALSTCFRPD